MSFQKIKKAALLARDILPDYPGLEEAIDPIKGEEALESRPDLNHLPVGEGLNEMRLDYRRVQKLKSAGEVMADFSPDAAKLKVVEMYHAPESGERQRAQETVLNYALGRPVERRMSMEMKVSGSSDKEIDNEINRLLAKFGFQGGEGETTSLIISQGGSGEPGETEELQSERGVSEGVLPEPEED